MNRGNNYYLVLFVHAALAYTTAAFINSENPIASSNPVAIEQRWIGFDLIVALNETFSMSLLFFVSGIFVWHSLTRKGAWKYFGDRLKRLGLLFVIGVLFLIPLAYYPVQLEVGLITEKNTSYGVFWLGMVRSGFGTAGPIWFLRLLLAFNCLVVLLYQGGPLLGGFFRGRLNNILGRLVAFFGVLLGISISVYLPIAIIFGPLKRIGIGPFTAQAGRILLYLAYFLTGTAIGAIGIDRTVFKPEGAIAKRFRNDILTLTLPKPFFHRMEEEANDCVFQIPSWKRLVGVDINSGLSAQQSARRDTQFINLLAYN
jgi:hypothetical protein